MDVPSEEGSGPQDDQEKYGVAGAPCKSCPYRRDVPSGVWSAEEYAKLPGYDGEIIGQLLAGAGGLFLCHQRDGNLCAGWLATHGAENLLALRMNGNRVNPQVWEYKTRVPVFSSGAEATAHGLADIAKPGVLAGRTIERLVRKHRSRG